MYETMLIVSVLVFAATTFVYLRQPSASIFSPATFYLLFHGLVFVIRPIFAWYYNFSTLYKVIGFTPTVWDKTEVLLATNLSLIVFMTVSVASGKRFAFLQDTYDLEQRRKLLAAFLPVAALLSIASIYSLYSIWQIKDSGVTYVLRDTRTGGTALVGVNGYFISLGSMLTSITAIIAYLGRFRLWSLAPFLAFAVLKLGTGGRGDFVAGATMIALLFLFDRRKKWPNMLVVLAVLACIPIFNAVQDDRGAGIRETVGFGDTEVQVGESDEAPLESMDFANMEFFEYIVYVVPQRSGTYDYFVANLQLFTEPIPRALWPNKPVGAPINRIELYSYGAALGATMSVPGVGWFSWGFPGVAIWSAFFGLIYGLAYRRFAQSRQNNLAVIAFMIFVSTSIVAYRDGSLLTILKQCLFYYVPVVALALVTKFTGIPSADAMRVEGEPEDGFIGPTPSAIRPRDRRAGLAIEAAEKPPGDDRARIVAGQTPRARRLARMKSA